MTEEEKKKIEDVVDREIEKLKGSFSDYSCEVIHQLMLDKMFADIEKLQQKKVAERERFGAIKRILRSVKSSIFK